MVVNPMSAQVSRLTPRRFSRRDSRRRTRLLAELKAWVEADPESGTQPAKAIRHTLEIESDLLLDAGVAGIAGQNIPYLYATSTPSSARYLNIAGRAFQKAMEREAEQAEQAYEEVVHEYMRDTSCNKLETVQCMEGSALVRLQDRQERVISWVESILESR
jgi:hypothetical protein